MGCGKHLEHPIVFSSFEPKNTPKLGLYLDAVFVHFAFYVFYEGLKHKLKKQVAFYKLV